MRITVVGGGNVGFSLARNLAQEHHEITLVDSNERTVEKIGNALDIIGYVGNGASFNVLKEINIENCDLLIAVTGSDELNLLACLSAHKLGAKNTIARVRNPEYAGQLFDLKHDLGLSMFINPEKATAEEIARVFRFPSASHVELFARGKIELVSFRLPQNNKLNNEKLMSLSSKFGIKVLICAVDREGELFIPSGNFVLQAGDELYLTGAPADMEQAFQKIGIHANPIKSVMVAGGNRVSYYLANALKSYNINLKIIEPDKQTAVTLAEQLPDAVVLNADPSDLDSLLEEGLDKSDSFVALTDLDEGNILSALTAKQHNVPKVIAKINSDNMTAMAKRLGIETLVSPKHIMTNSILRYVRALHASQEKDNILSLYKLLDGRAEVLEFTAEESIDGLTDTPLLKLKLKKNILIACIVRGAKTIVPGGHDKIEKGDGVLVVTAGSTLNKLSDILEED